MLLAVSGGIDSVAMVDLFLATEVSVGIAHVNFGLRGEESEGDEQFVRDLAKRHSIPFYTTRFNTLSLASEQGVSTQMMARQLRYDWFGQLAREYGYSCVATAHHSDDNLETVLLNLIRGTGVAGLRGISVQQDFPWGRLVRPLWFASRADLEQYVQEQGLPWREDSSNVEDKYRRNRLRHQVVPVLKELNPNLLQTIQATYERVGAAENLVEQALSHSWKALIQQQGERLFIPLQALQALPEWPFRLSEWLRPFGFRYAQIQPIAEAVRGTSFGQTFESGTHRILRDREALVITPKGANETTEISLDQLPTEPLRIDEHLSLVFSCQEKPTDFIIPADARVACLDADQVKWPLTIRRWRAGDRFQPLGMKGSQAIGDWFTNRKIALHKRESSYVLLSGETIVWLIGYRIDNRFRLQEQTHKLLFIKVL
ncbi:tRNA lysidine(34) synthetase TilS [Tellurirhabdus bombi]|uniref:tRNA lysidine(34) synthetase TilS n=1 Tax=Tellurirhabdus bombi TaxID=2907205 RepID=UPI001F1F9F5E|nr:tRNA lysidine(34) synthetase TilS [Tellurirhabdus bombi]